MRVALLLAAAAALRPPTQLRVATFNLLAPVHKSGVGATREADDDATWLARGARLADFVAETLGSSDALCLQEWFFEPRWGKMFEEALPRHALVTSRRRGVHPHSGKARSDGVAMLVRGKVLAREEVVFDDGRAALIVAVDRSPRPVVVANVHLPFGSGGDAAAAQARQAAAVAEAAAALAARVDASLALIAGDFNCGAAAPACAALEAAGWTNVVSASAAEALSSVGGRTCVGATHRTHRGEALCCDHVFAAGASAFGQCDGAARLVAAARVAPGGVWDYDFLDKDSDHLPVSATFALPAAAAAGRADDDDAQDPWLPPWPQPPRPR